MNESRILQRAGRAGATSVVLLAVGVALCASAGVDEPGVSDAAILEMLHDGARRTAAGIGLLVLGAGIALLLWFAVRLRRVLDRLSGGDPLAHAAVPAVALLGALMVTGVSLQCRARSRHGRTSSPPTRTQPACSAWLIVALTGLTGGAAPVAATTRIAQQAHALPPWAVGVLPAARRTPPAPAVLPQGAPAPEAARTPPTATSG